MKITPKLAAIATVLSVIGGGGIWGILAAFYDKNAWAADMKRVETSAKQSRRQLTNEANATILDIQLLIQKLDVHRLRTLEAQRQTKGRGLTISEREELEIAVLKRDNLTKALLKLNKIKTLESQIEEGNAQ